MNKPASLTAGVCSLCITAAMVAVPPQAAAAELPVVQHRSVSMLNQPYELTAASQALQNLLRAAGIPSYNPSAPESIEFSQAQLDLTEAREVTEALLAVLGLPSYYLFTTLATLGGLTNFVTGINLASSNIYKGNWGAVPDNLKKAWDDEVAAVKAVLNLPTTLVEETKLRLGNLVPDPAPIEGAIVQTDVPTDLSKALAETEAPEVTEALLAVLGLPSYYLYTTLATLGGLTNFVTGINLASSNIYKGNWGAVPDNLKKAWDDEVAAVKAVLNLPKTLVEGTKLRLGNLAPASAANLKPDGLSVETFRVTTTEDDPPKFLGGRITGYETAKIGDDTGDNKIRDNIKKETDNIRDNIDNVRDNIKEETDKIRANIKEETDNIRAKIDKRTEAKDEGQTEDKHKGGGANPTGGRHRAPKGATASTSPASTSEAA